MTEYAKIGQVIKELIPKAKKDAKKLGCGEIYSFYTVAKMPVDVVIAPDWAKSRTIILHGTYKSIGTILTKFASSYELVDPESEYITINVKLSPSCIATQQFYYYHDHLNPYLSEKPLNDVVAYTPHSKFKVSLL